MMYWYPSWMTLHVPSCCPLTLRLVRVSHCDAGRHPAAADRRWPQSGRDLLSGLHPRLWGTFTLRQYINRGSGGESTYHTWRLCNQQMVRNHSQSSRVYLPHSSHNPQWEAFQVLDVINPGRGLKSEGAPKVSFARGKLLQVFMDSLEGRYDKKMNGLIIFSRIFRLVKKPSGLWRNICGVCMCRLCLFFPPAQMHGTHIWMSYNELQHPSAELSPTPSLFVVKYST